MNIVEINASEKSINTTNYDFDGKVFTVESVFKETSEETFGSILLRLIRNEI